MLHSLSLTSFRNYDRLEVEIPSALCVVVGQNAQGKTNLLEAIYLLGSGRLLRGRRDAEAIQDGAFLARVAGNLRDSGMEIAVELKAGVRKRAYLNGASLPRASDLIGRMPTVCFSNADLSIVRGEPADRRLFLDGELAQIYPAYLRRLSVYKRALEHRNALLKAAQEVPQLEEHFEIWEAELASNGGPIRQTRVDFLKELGDRASALHAELGAGEVLRLAYQPADESESTEDLAMVYRKGRQREIQRGSTLFGPHRDDLTLFVEDREARLFGSQGQQRTACIALKLAVLDLAAEQLRERPILLLDDVFSELDAGRRARLSAIADRLAGQTIVTCTEPEQAGEHANARWLHVRGGEVSDK